MPRPNILFRLALRLSGKSGQRAPARAQYG